MIICALLCSRRSVLSRWLGSVEATCKASCSNLISIVLTALEQFIILQLKGGLCWFFLLLVLIFNQHYAMVYSFFLIYIYIYIIYLDWRWLNIQAHAIREHRHFISPVLVRLLAASPIYFSKKP